MKFPREKLVLFSLRAEFIDLENLLNFSKRHRAFKRSFYVTIDYPDSFDILLVRQGELSKVIRIAADSNSSKEVSLKDVGTKIKHTDSSIVNMGFVDDQLLAMMNADLEDQNVVRETDGESLSPADLLKELSTQHFSGILAVRRRSEKSYALINEGDFALVYLTSGGRNKDDFIKYLNQDKKELSIKILREIPEDASYATSAQVELLVTSTNRVLEEFSAILGRNIVKKITEISLKGVTKEFDFFTSFNILDDAKIEGDPKVETDNLTRGFAAFFNMLADSLSTISGGRHIAVLKKALQDYRFALNNLKFFEYVKEQIF
ncbi:hypothetical protein JXM67_03150 [candidate division WOR-3 bacterium]|nr:hypothetical protein [candidate division WOR-3 bacterium]